MRKIPLSVLKPIAAGPWRSDEFSLNIFDATFAMKYDPKNPNQSPSSYCLKDDDSNGLTKKELKDIIKSGAIDPSLFKNTTVNEHWMHSYEQFAATVEVAWQVHLDQISKLLATPLGHFQNH